MSYTTLRVIEQGIVLFEQHLRRIAPQPGVVRDRFLAFAKGAYPGVYSVRVIDADLFVEWRAASRLVDGLPIRYAPSPYADRVGAFPKPPPPAYSPVRAEGVVTLLTLEDGTLAEADNAAIVSVREGRVVLVPEASPRVDSGAEREIERSFDVVRAPIRVDGDDPILLVNAVKLTCGVDAPGRREFPAEVRGRIEACLLATARRSPTPG